MFAAIHDAPATTEMYARVLELLGHEQPPGLVLHLALAKPEGGLRYVDVWESQAAHEAFEAERLGPAVRRMLTEHGIPVDEGGGPEGPLHPPTFEFGVVDVVLGATGAGRAWSDALTSAAAARPS